MHNRTRQKYSSRLRATLGKAPDLYLYKRQADRNRIDMPGSSAPTSPPTAVTVEKTKEHVLSGDVYHRLQEER